MRTMKPPECVKECERLMNKTLKNLVRKLGVVVCLCMVCLLLTVPACASEDWNALNISITYEYQGETVTVNATLPEPGPG